MTSTIALLLACRCFLSGRNGQLLGLFPHTRIFKHVHPLPAHADVTVVETLPQVIDAVRVFGLIALAEFVDFDTGARPGGPNLRDWGIHHRSDPLVSLPRS